MVPVIKYQSRGRHCLIRLLTDMIMFCILMTGHLEVMMVKVNTVGMNMIRHVMIMNGESWVSSFQKLYLSIQF